MDGKEVMKALGAYPLQGVRYNVVRRPLSGGIGTISRHKATQGRKCSSCKGTGKKSFSALEISSRTDFNVSCPSCRGACRVDAKPEETKEAYYARLSGIIAAEPQTYFMRWNVVITQADIERFRRECLDPILEQLCDWWSWVSEDGCPFEVPKGILIRNNKTGKEVIDTSVSQSSPHWRHPFGVWNSLNEGGSSDLDSYLNDGSMTGLQRIENLFTELT